MCRLRRLRLRLRLRIPVYDASFGNARGSHQPPIPLHQRRWQNTVYGRGIKNHFICRQPLKGQSQLSISLDVEIAKLLALVQTTWFQTKTLAVIGLFQKSILYFIERVPRNPYLLTITVGLVTSRGLCGAFVLGTSLFLRIDCLCGAALLHTYWDWVSMLMLMLLELIIYFVFVFRMLLPFYFIFSYT